MRSIFAVSAFALISTASLAAAPVVSENLAGTISGPSTVDKKGYFGTAGADLSGAAISIYIQYVPTLLGPSQACRNHSCTYNQSVQAPDTQGSVLITITANGHRLVYAPAYQGVVFFPTQSPYQLTIDSDADSGFGIGLPGVQLGVPLTAAPLFGQPLLPASPPVLNKTDDYIAFFTANDQTPVEQLSFAVAKATR